MVNFCSNCGSKISKGAKYCPNCGTNLEEKITEIIVPDTTNNVVSITNNEANSNNEIKENDNIQNNTIEEKTGTNGLAIAGFVCSLCGIFFARIIFGALAIIFSIIAKNQLKASKNQKGKGLSTAGLIIGIVDIAIILIWLFILFIIGFVTGFLSEFAMILM